MTGSFSLIQPHLDDTQTFKAQTTQLIGASLMQLDVLRVLEYYLKAVSVNQKNEPKKLPSSFDTLQKLEHHTKVLLPTPVQIRHPVQIPGQSRHGQCQALLLPDVRGKIQIF